MKAELTLLVVWLFLRLTTGQRNANPDSENEKVLALQQTLKTLFNLPEFEPQQGNSVEPPRHMVHLLQHLSKASEWNQGRKWNTIRTLRPQLGPICEMDNLFRFDLTSLPPEEGVVSLQFHFFKFKTDLGKDDEAKIKLDILEIYPSRCQLIRSLNVPAASDGWQVADLTSRLNMTRRHRLATSFALRFRLEKGVVSKFSAQTSLRYIEENVIRHSTPFVMVFTKDYNLKEDKSEQAQSETESDADSSGLEPDDMYLHGNMTYSGRQRRSVHNVPLQTNEYPEIMDEETYYTVHETFPKFSERNRQRKTKKRTRARKIKSKRKHTKTLLEKQRKKSRKKSGDRDDDYGESQWDLCSRRFMKVDFGMIGWNNYVISPKSFDAYFCAGACPFPMTKELNPSNHAAVQSIVHALEAVKGVPPPCCVPDKLSPLSILYFDAARNVVLKVYPNMAVETCACH